MPGSIEPDELLDELERKQEKLAELRREISSRRFETRDVLRQANALEREVHGLRYRLAGMPERRKPGLLARARAFFRARPEDRATVAALEQQVADLEREIERQRRLHRVTRGLRFWVFRLLVGTKLETAARTWFSRLQEVKKPWRIDSGTHANLFVAVAHRTIRFGVLAVLITQIGPILMVWQNSLLRQQLRNQEEDTMIVRRSELLELLYGVDCAETLVEPCRLDAPIRVREEAFLSFLTIEKKRLSRKAERYVPDLDRVIRLPSLRLEEAELVRKKLQVREPLPAEMRRPESEDSPSYTLVLTSSFWRKARLEGSTFFRADLSDADLSDTDLDQATLRSVRAENARFVEADLRKARLIDVRAPSADFGGAKLSAPMGTPDAYTSITHSELELSDFTDAFAQGLQIHESTFDRAIFAAADLTRAEIESSSFVQAKFHGAPLRKLRVKDASDFTRAVFREADLTGALLPRANLERADFREAEMRGVDLTFAKAELAYFYDADLTGALLSHTRLYSADFSEAHLDEADLSCNRSLQGINFRGTHFRRAKLQGADFTRVRSLQGASFHEALLEGTDLRGVDLRQTLGLAQSQIDSALVDDRTRLPGNLQIPDTKRTESGPGPCDPIARDLE